MVTLASESTYLNKSILMTLCAEVKFSSFHIIVVSISVKETSFNIENLLISELLSLRFGTDIRAKF